MKKVIIFGVSILFLDQLTKFFVLRFLPLGESVRVFGNFMRLTHIHNPYGVFGISFGGGVSFLILNFLALCLLIVFLYKVRYPVLGVIVGGALGNLIDRIRLQGVVDFLDFGVGSLRWPAFNIADSAITTGIIILIIRNVKIKYQKAK